MAFTDRFLEVPVEVYNKQADKQAELLGKENDDQQGFPSTMKILPLEIQGYHPEHDKNGDPEAKTILYLKGDANGIKVILSVQKFEKVLNDFMK